ncbi:alpha/beta fold hydrolase [Nocardia otitidiscaviarum]|uniref:alpha/beta fold hydrolase n=1 Tax=Nocardia otitidiscaviarum TaxID=1823 RepID=UPI0004A7252A|nr:alpha/beta hydrolase [Nocardia otitidiscaviarum]MBF6131999.1 alpha/beta fold hydrolase [Nocardia otitidiscaviarum]MBF6483129.1 alpha/beta fold hydrolase [Nocardia otitidiscaviarum]
MADLQVHRFGPSTGPLVLALHGLTGHGNRWRALADEQLPEVRMVAPDLRGHGRSTSLPPWDFETVVADLVTVLTAETGKPAVVVGHSFGGAVAIHLARARPDLVRALILLDPAIGIDPVLLHDIARSTLEHPDYESAEAARFDKLETGWAEVEPRLLDAELAEHLVPTGGGRVGWRLFAPAVLSYWGQLARDVVLPPAGMPTVLVQAAKVRPPFVPPAFRAALTDQLGDRLAVHDFDCDHMVSEARPAETAALVRAVLATT